MKAIYRVSTENDIDKLVEFWNENAGWDVIDRKEWKKRFYDTPLGPCPVILVLEKETGSIIAHFVFIPALISFQGQQLHALRPFAPVVSKKIRSALGLLTLVEYVLKMYNYAFEYFSGQNMSLFYMLPDPRWAKAFQVLPNIQTAKFPLWSLKLKSEISIQLPPGFVFEPVDPSDSRIDRLWEKASLLYDCSIIRNSKTLPWKLSHKKYHVYGLNYASELVGFCASFYRREDRQWLICDLLAINTEILSLMISTACAQAWAHKLSLEKEEQDRLGKVAILATPFLQTIIKAMGFEKDKYDFPVAVHILDKNLSKKDIQPEKWYVSAHD